MELAATKKDHTLPTDICSVLLLTHAGGVGAVKLLSTSVGSATTDEAPLEAGSR